MIQRFEDEYPECRPTPAMSIPQAERVSLDRSDAASSASSNSGSLANPGSLTSADPASLSTSNGSLHGTDSASDDEHDAVKRPFLSRHNSDVSIAARALSIEEAQVHRMGQKVKRELLSPSGGRADNGWNSSSGGEHLGTVHTLDENGETEHLKLLRSKLDALQGEELRNRVVEEGWEETAKYAIGKARSGGQQIDSDVFRAEKEKVRSEIERTERMLMGAGELETEKSETAKKLMNGS